MDSVLYVEYVREGVGVKGSGKLALLSEIDDEKTRN